MKKKIFASILGLAAVGMVAPLGTANADSIRLEDSPNVSLVDVLTIVNSHHDDLRSNIIPLVFEESPAFVHTTEARAGFETKTGTIVHVSIHEDLSTVRLQMEDHQVDFTISADTVFVDESGIITLDKLEVGDTITAHYIPPMIMPMIYPARFPASVLVKAPTNGTIHVGFFEDMIIDHTHQLKVNLGPDTLRITPDGEPHRGPLEFKFLVVYYTSATRSLPAQVTPSKIIVLDHIESGVQLFPSDGIAYEDIILGPVGIPGTDLPEGATTRPATPDDFVILPGGEIRLPGGATTLPGAPIEAGELGSDVEFAEFDTDLPEIPSIYVEDIPYLQFVTHGIRLEATKPFLSDATMLMLPLRSIAEGLGYTLSWNAEERRIGVGEFADLKVGEDVYSIGAFDVSLGQAPEIRDGLTYVPLEFFIQVLGINVTIDGTTLNFSL